MRRGAPQLGPSVRLAGQNGRAWSPPSSPVATRCRTRRVSPPASRSPRGWTWRVDFPGEKAEKAAEKLGIETVGALLEHIPRDRRAARTIEELAHRRGRHGRRRGLLDRQPAGAATRHEATRLGARVRRSGTMTVTFFNQPWLERRYRPGTRLLLTGKYQGHRGFRVNEHAETGELVATGEDMATYPASEGLTSVQIAALVARAPGDRARRARAAAGADPRARAASGPLRRRSTPRTSATRRAAAGGSPSTSSCCSRSRSLRRRARRREGARAARARAAGRADRALAARVAAVHAHRRPAAAMAAIDEDLAGDRPMQRLLMGEVGSGKTVVALYAMLRAVESGAPGGADGADRDARRAALRHAAEADARRARPGRAADRLDARGAPRRPARQAGHAASCGCWSARTR